MKTKLVFTGIIMAFFLNACTIDELEMNTIQIDLKIIEISELKNGETLKDTLTIRTGEGVPPKD